MMKNLLAALLAFGLAFHSYSQALTFHSYDAVTITEDTISLSQFYGKKVMVVNTASFCAFTPQFEDLENLYLQYNAYNFEILGFPCNDFSNQDPHNDSTILDFCTSNYNVTFPMMSKVQIVTGDTAPVYKWLQRADLNGVANAHVAWNFNKFLIDEAGHWVRHFTSTTLPGDTAITNWIMSPSVVSGIQNKKTNSLIGFGAGNVISSNLVVNISPSNTESITIQIFSATGQLVGNVFGGIPSGSQTIDFPVANLPAGIYLLRANNGFVTQTERFSVVR